MLFGVTTAECSFTSKLTTPFHIPDRCNNMVTAGKCRASVTFRYDREKYDVSLQAASLNTFIDLYNDRHIICCNSHPLLRSLSLL